jgi:signal transduction histidine kinase
MNPIVVLPLLFAVVNLTIGGLHLMLYIKRPDPRENLFFAILCFCNTAYSLLCAGLYSVDNAQDAMFWQEAQYYVISISMAMQIWFISDFTKQQARTPKYILSGIYMLGFVIAAVGGTDVLFQTESPHIREFTWFSGYTFEYHEMTLGPVWLISSFMFLVSFAYFFWCAVSKIKQRQLRRSFALLLILLLYAIVIINDTMVAHGLINSIYLLEYSFVLFAILMTLVLTDDLFETVLLKQKLVVSEKRLKEAEAMAHVGHFHYQEKPEILEFSEEAKRIYDILPKTKLNLTSFLRKIHPEDMKEVIEFLDKQLKPGNAFTLQHRIIDRSANIKYVVINIKVASGDSEHPIHLLGSVLDVTVLKKVEMELIKHRDNLEYLVEERTEELKCSNEQLNSQKQELERTIIQLKNTQEQLIQTEKMATIGTLTAGVAHEINNPLNYIQAGLYALTSFLKKGILQSTTEEVQDQLDQILHGQQEGVVRIAKIVKNLNTFSQKGMDDWSTCSVLSIIDNCLLILDHELTSRAITVDKQIENDISLDGVEAKFQQAFINLLTNAIQAIDSDGCITIKAWTKKAPQCAYIEITDNGKGIPNSQMNRIFDPFYTTKDPGEGIGIGLSIALSIIKEFKGTIDVKSTPGKGSTFRISFPIQ